MRGPAIPREASWLRYQERKRRDAEVAWAQDAAAPQVRSAVSDWVTSEARRRAENAAVDERTGRLGPPLERLLLLAGLPDSARRFATLSRQADDDAAALWMLGLAAADAVAASPDPATWRFARAIVTADAWEAFETELTSRLRADPLLFERFIALAEAVVDAEVADPASCVPSHEREQFSAAIAGGAEPVDLAALNRSLPGTDLYWGPSAEILSLVHALNRENFAALLTRFRLPHPVQAALADRAITDDVQEIAALLRSAPSTFDGGVRMISTIAPLLLWAGIEHLRRRSRWLDEPGSAEDMTDEALTADLAWAASELAAATLDRGDGRSLGFAWATTLVRDLAWRLPQAERVPPPASDASVAPAWFALNALVEHPAARSWVGWRPPDVAPDDAYFAAVAAALPALAADDLTGLVDERLPIPASLNDAEGIEATRTAVTLATRPSDWLYQILGWTIAQGPDPVRRWLDLWRSITAFREQDLRRLGRNLDIGFDAVAKAVWGCGLGALDWLSAGETAAAVEAHDALYPCLRDAALECWLTTPLPEEYWSSAVVHIAVRWSRPFRRRAESDDPAPATFEEEVRVLASVIGPFVAPSEHFLRLLRSLQRNGTSLATIRDALIANGSGLDDVIANVGALGALDTRFASRTTELLEHLAAPIDAPGPPSA